MLRTRILFALLVLILGATSAIRAAETRSAPPPRVAWLLDDTPPPPRLAQALQALAEACERGDRVGFIALMAPASRAEAQSLADHLVSSPATPLHAVRIEVLSLTDADGTLLLHAIAPVTAPPEPLPAPPEGFTRAIPGSRVAPLAFEATESGGRILLSLKRGFPATVSHAQLEVRLDAKPPRARSQATLRLDAAPRVALLEVGEGASVRTDQAGVVLTPIEAVTDRGGQGAVRVEWPGEAARGQVTIETDVILPQNAIKQGSIALLHQSQVIPFATGHHFRFELVMDVPLPNRSVSVGILQDLPAPEGRRRTRWTCDRHVDYLPLAAGPYEITTQGEGSERLELWRTREVGGDPQAMLTELRELVDFQEKAIAPLPYRAFRLVELPTMEGLAVSYASLIFMTPDLLATRDLRVEILSHEVGHQWWGNAVSPHPTARWSAEGMADAMKDLFVLRRFGQEHWLDRQDEHRKRLLQMLGASSRPLGTSPGGGDAYDRGALFVHALRAELGDEMFWKVLRRWYARLADAEPLTSDLRREAEAEAGRSLGVVFEPWLGTTALPIVAMEWSAQDGGVAITLRQDEPAFPLDVPLRASAGDRVVEWTMRLDAREAASHRALDFVPDRVDLDPGHLLPRVLDAEWETYMRGEAAACLARGDARRARSLLETLAARSLLLTDPAIVLFAARVLDGVPPVTARRDLDVVLAEIPDAERRQVALVAAADGLMEQGAPAAALPILEALDAEMRDGASVPRKLGLALRALGREAEAQAALRRALQRRPADEATLAALGERPAAEQGLAPTAVEPAIPALPPAATTTLLTAAMLPLLPAGDALMKGSAPEGTSAVSLSGGRFALLLSGPRALLTGKAGAMKRLAGFAPVGALDVAADPAAAKPVLAVLETARQSSRLTILEVDAEGVARVVATHARAPGGARALVRARDGGIVAAWLGAEGAWDWRRLKVPLRVSSAGPDDDEGLRRIRVTDDPRWESVATMPEPPPGATGGVAVELPEMGWVSVRDDGKRLAGAEQVAWEALGDKVTIRSARPWRDGVALIVASDASVSPLKEDALRSLRLIVFDGEFVHEEDLPEGTLDASLAPDGSLVLEVVPQSEDAPRLLTGRLELPER